MLFKTTRLALDTKGIRGRSLPAQISDESWRQPALSLLLSWLTLWLGNKRIDFIVNFAGLCLWHMKLYSRNNSSGTSDYETYRLRWLPCMEWVITKGHYLEVLDHLQGWLFSLIMIFFSSFKFHTINLTLKIPSCHKHLILYCFPYVNEAHSRVYSEMRKDTS